MCNACGFPERPGAWTEAGAASLHDRLRARLVQGDIANRMLGPHGLSARDAGPVPGIMLSTRTGAAVLVPDLPTLWAEAARLLGAPVDPLDPRLCD
ncbi:hypothetical protein [Falsirhodobacter sp. alg1]|uniref:hypothetical protein n=1 Tax=Falsirhodobacter sp. alg1 TaxID=1472418 RepID=UPI0005EFC8A8|nr:hypothetical protein [Falsirhodobacter sp. alg1]